MKTFVPAFIYAVIVTTAFSSSISSADDLSTMKQLMDKIFDKTLQKLNEDGLFKKLREAETQQSSTQAQKVITDANASAETLSEENNRKLPMTVQHHKRRIVSMKHGKVFAHNNGASAQSNEIHHEEAHHGLLRVGGNNIEVGDKPTIYFKDQGNDHGVGLFSLPEQTIPFTGSDNGQTSAGEPKDKNVTLQTHFSEHKLIKKHDKETVEKSNNHKTVSHKTHIDNFYRNDKIESKDHRHTTKHTIGVDEYNTPYKEDIMENSLHKLSHVINHDRNDANKDEEIITMTNMIQEFSKDDSFDPLDGSGLHTRPVDFLNGVGLNKLGGAGGNTHSIAVTHHVNAVDTHDNEHNILVHHNTTMNDEGVQHSGFVHHSVQPQFSNNDIDQLLAHLQDGNEDGAPSIFGSMFGAQNLNQDNNDSDGDDAGVPEFFHFKDMNRVNPSPLPSVHKEINGSPFPPKFGDFIAGLLEGLGDIPSGQDAGVRPMSIQHEPFLGGKQPTESPFAHPAASFRRFNPHAVIPSLQDHEAEPHTDYRPVPQNNHFRPNNGGAQGMPDIFGGLFSLLGNIKEMEPAVEAVSHKPSTQQLPQQIRPANRGPIVDSSDSDEEPSNIMNTQGTSSPVPIVDSSDSDEHLGDADNNQNNTGFNQLNIASINRVPNIPNEGLSNGNPSEYTEQQNSNNGQPFDEQAELEDILNQQADEPDSEIQGVINDQDNNNVIPGNPIADMDDFVNAGVQNARPNLNQPQDDDRHEITVNVNNSNQPTEDITNQGEASYDFDLNDEEEKADLNMLNNLPGYRRGLL